MIEETLDAFGGTYYVVNREIINDLSAILHETVACKVLWIFLGIEEVVLLSRVL